MFERRIASPSLFPRFLHRALLVWVACLVHLQISTAFVKKGWSTIAGESESTNSTRPKIYFLFLADNGLPNQEIWLRFLTPATAGVDYEIFVHCQDAVACHKNISAKQSFHIIPTVPSKWCEDLVSPMDALLQAALTASGTGTDVDSFTFVSDTTVPVKPFKTVWQRMAMDRKHGSSFCVTPRHWWGVADGNQSMVVKHHQWMTLSRAHATRVVAKQNQMRDLMQVISPEDWVLGDFLTPYYQETLGKFFGRARVNGCLDEYLYFALVYGFVDRDFAAAGQEPFLRGFTGNPLNLTEAGTQEYQGGKCDTLAFFGYGADFARVTKELEADGVTQIKPSWLGLHPASFHTLSDTSLKVLSRSQFLFARKIDSRSMRFMGRKAKFDSLADAFDQLVFQTGKE